MNNQARNVASPANGLRQEAHHQGELRQHSIVNFGGDTHRLFDKVEFSETSTQCSTGPLCTTGFRFRDVSQVEGQEDGHTSHSEPLPHYQVPRLVYLQSNYEVASPYLSSGPNQDADGPELRDAIDRHHQASSLVGPAGEGHLSRHPNVVDFMDTNPFAQPTRLLEPSSYFPHQIRLPDNNYPQLSNHFIADYGEAVPEPNAQAQTPSLSSEFGNPSEQAKEHTTGFFSCPDVLVSANSPYATAWAASPAELEEHQKTTPFQDHAMVAAQKTNSCWQCLFKHEKCRGGTPCEKCAAVASRRGHSLWRMGCSRDRVQDFLSVLFPDTLTCLVKLSSIVRFHHQHAWPAAGTVKFELPLTTGYGNPIIVSGKLVVPKSDELRYWKGLSCDDRGEAVVVKQAVSPIVVASPYAEIDSKLRQWLDDVIRTDLGAWIDYSFTNGSDPWTPIILGAVHHFYRNSNAWQASSDGHGKRSPGEILRRALKMAILASVMVNRIHIPNFGRKLIQNHIRSQQSSAIDSCEVPRSVNKVFKLCVFQILSEYVKDVLSSLDCMLRVKGNSHEGHTLCVLVLLAVVVSIHQVSILDICFLSGQSTTENSRFDKETSLMEDRLFFMSMELFHRKFKVQRIDKRYGDLDEHTRVLVNNIVNIPSKSHFAQFQHRAFRDLPQGRAALVNTPRLLARLLAPFLSLQNEKE